MISIQEQVAGARRELAMRESAYPRWVARGKMTSAKAVHELSVMRAILETLTEVEKGGRLL